MAVLDLITSILDRSLDGNSQQRSISTERGRVSIFDPECSKAQSQPVFKKKIIKASTFAYNLY